MANPSQLSLPESFWAAEGRRLAVLIVPRLTSLALEGARRGSEKIGIGFVYGIYNLLAEQWAREYTDALLLQVRTTNEAVVGDILARWISTVGSTFGELHAALQPYFGVKRASVIAVTEATRAMASGELLAYQRAGIERIQWGTNKDELVCPYCGVINREVRKIGEPFGYFRWRKGQQPEPVYAPPYHPNCRCGISPVLASVTVRKTVLILTDAAIVARTLRTLPPLLAKGDFDGHPFRGNQWTDKQTAGPAPDKKSKKKSAETFDPMKPVRPSRMDAETKALLNNWTDAGQEVVDENFIAHTQNTPSDIWYHSSREGFDISKENAGGFGFNYGSALYAGKDPFVLFEFYGTWDEENPAQVYAFRGELKMLDMRSMKDEKYYTEAALDTFPNAKTPRLALRSFALAAGFDGITYFDGSATGEEYAIFNFDKLENIGVVPYNNLKKIAGPADLAKGDFDGHPFRGNQWTEDGAGPAEKTGVAAIDNPYDFVRDRRNTELPSAIENGIDGGPAQSILYHGTTTRGLESLTSEHGDVYITPQPDEAAGYAMDMHRFGSKAKPGEVLLVRRRAGKTLNLTEAISDGFENGYEPDEVIAGVRQAAKDRGFRYLYFSHPSFADNEEQHAIISLFPEEDLRVLKRQRVKKLAKHDGPGNHPNGSPQSVHGGPLYSLESDAISFSAEDSDIYDFVVSQLEDGGWEGKRAGIAQDAMEQVSEYGQGLMVEDNGEAVAVGAFAIEETELIGKKEIPKALKNDASVVVISFLATKRKGYGREAMQNVVDYAAGEGLGIWLHSVPEAFGYYEAIGMHRHNPYGRDEATYFYWTADEVKKMERLQKAADRPAGGVPDADEPEGGLVIVPAGYVMKQGLAKGDFDGHPFRGNQWTETEKGIDSRGALWRRYPVRDVKGNATKSSVYMVDGGEDLPEPLVDDINKNTSEGWRLVRFNYNAKSKTWHIANAGEDDVPVHAMFANESMEANGTEADDLVRGFYDVEENSISIYDFTGFDNENLVRTKATEKYLRSAERNLFTLNGEKPKLLYLTLDDMQMAAGPGDLVKGDFDGHPFRGNQYDHAGAVASDQHAIEMASTVPGEKKMPWEMTREEYDSLEVIYRGTGSRSKKEGPAFFTNDQEVARAHGKVNAFRLLPGAVIYPDPEMEGAEDRPLTGRESLDLGSAVLSYDDLVPDFAFDVWKKSAGPGDLAKGDFDGHPFRGNQWTSFTGLLVGKNKRNRFHNTVDYFGINVNPKRELEVKPEHDAFWNYREQLRLKSEEKWNREQLDQENNGESNGEPDTKKIEDYGQVNVRVSHAKTPNAGFPEGHPLSNPDTRVSFVNSAVQELSYSNKVGYGGALKQAAQGKKDGDLYQYFSNKLPAGVSLEDVLKATYQETQGMLDEIGAPAIFNLYHGSFAFSGNSEKKVKIGEEFKGFSSWSSADHKAAGFGTHLVFSKIPRERMLIIPAQIPKQLAGVPSFLGGSRDESEYVVVHDDMFDWIGE